MEEQLHALASMFSTQTISALETVQVQEIFGETDENKRKRVEVQEQLPLLEGGLSRLELLEYNSPVRRRMACSCLSIIICTLGAPADMSSVLYHSPFLTFALAPWIAWSAVGVLMDS